MIKVIKAGFQTSIQDLGRKGYRHLGICYSGALHSHLLKVANALVGNDENTTAIEFSTGVLELYFSIDCVIAVCGSAVEALVTDKTTRKHININQATYIYAGQHLVIKPKNSGLRNYLSIAGGILGESFFESASTDITVESGGLNGQLIKTNNSLKLEKQPTADRLRALVEYKFNAKLDAPSYQIRAIPGPEYAYFSEQSQNDFWSNKWQISQQANRVGCWLLGPTLNPAYDKNNQNGNAAQTLKGKLLSHGILPGTVQVPEMGRPVVLLADAQTTGGYPRIATVISADLWQFTQIPVNAHIQFIACNRSEAIDALQQQHFEFNRFKIALDAKLSLKTT